MKTCNWIKGLALVVWALVAATATYGAPLRVFAAASLQGPLDAVAAVWDEDVTISYAGSGTIARQISLGAPADVVILANVDWADWLVSQGHVAGPATTVISNRLVVVAPAGQPVLARADAENLLARLEGGRLAMGQHMSVPAGIYAQRWLADITAWDALRPHLAETENVRAALALVARGEAPLGIVYASDAQASAAVDVVWDVPSAAHPPIQYPGLSLTPEGAAFLEHVTTQTEAFVAAGFAALP
ncbi:molybdate ABC transporter substrate-binding protein [Tateyamaria sp. SN3-11]|uniref:molybdate ABC transporter substrate-binding protein n=1 Tax=Tateyamaria sp. SN3-11 TaxID=3092147 RepID=UPI0039E8211A